MGEVNMKADFDAVATNNATATTSHYHYPIRIRGAWWALYDA